MLKRSRHAHHVIKERAQEALGGELDPAAGGGLRHHMQAGRGVLWQRLQGPAQGVGPGAGHQAGARRHGPAGDHQGDLHHAAVRQPLRRQVLRLLLQEHRSLDCYGVLWSRFCVRYNEAAEENPI